MIDRASRFAGFALSALLLCACTAVPRAPEDSYYRLDVPAGPTGLPSGVPEGTLSVQVVAGAPVYHERALLYSETNEPARLQRYHYHYWIDSPPPMLRAGFVEYLRQASHAMKVVVPDDGVASDYRLRAVLDRFEHRRGPYGGRVVVAWSMTLVERASGRVLQQARIATEADVRGDEFTAVAAAFARAATELYDLSLSRLFSAGGAAEIAAGGGRPQPVSRP